MKKKLIIIRGNSGSGKTTTARQVQLALGRNIMVISQDVIRRDVLNAKDGQDNFALPLLMDMLKYGHENCDYVILEGILTTKWYQPLFLLAKELYSDIFAFYYDIPFEETVKRHQTRDKVNEFGEEHMRSWWNEKDYIEMIPETFITTEMKQNQVVDLILNTIDKDL